MIKYYPYPSDKPNKKYYIITNDNKKIYFGSKGYGDYPFYYQKYGKEIADKKRKAYIARHSKSNEDWTKSGINTSGFYSRYLLWEEPTLELAYKKIKEKLITWGII